jgi:selenocysteine lyase/cysteine desulfurase
VHGRAAIDAARLGRRFHIRDGETSFQRALAVAYRDHNTAAGRAWNAPIDAATRAAIRTAVAREKFAEQYGCASSDDRELSGFIARATRALTTAVAGYDLTFSPVKSVSVPVTEHDGCRVVHPGFPVRRFRSRRPSTHPTG